MELTNNGRGFGFGVISDTEGGRGTLVHSIIKGGIADKVRREECYELLGDSESMVAELEGVHCKV